MDLKEARRLIIQKLGGPKCSQCGRELPLDQLRLHHVNEGVGYNAPERWQDLKRWLESNDLTDVIVICIDCHRKVHGHRPRAFTTVRTRQKETV